MKAQMKIEVGPERAAVAARSRLYHHFSRVVRYPEADDPWREAVVEHPRTVADIAADLPYALSSPDACRPWEPPCDLQALQQVYTRLFEAAGRGSVIPLNESEYAHASRKDVWEDTIRFYEHFGLSYDGMAARDWPDHLGTELECLHYLSFLESGLPAGQTQLLRAQFDFIERHLINWLPRAVERVRSVPDSGPYAGILTTLVDFVEADHLHLGRAIES